jgi:co-chaperonin GroES (HSP10)
MIKPIGYKAYKQIEPEMASEYVGLSGLKFDIVPSKHGLDNVFWTNTVFEDLETGDKVFIKPQSVAFAFGHFDKKGSDGMSYTDEDGNKIRFFKKEEEYLRIAKNGDFIPNDGYCICERIKKDAPKSSYYEPKSSYYEDRFIVRYLGNTLKDEKDVKSNASTFFKLTQVVPEVGMCVLSNTFGGLPLFSDMNLKLDKPYFVVSYDSIMGYMDDNGDIFPLGDRVLISHKMEFISPGGILLNKPLSSRIKSGVVLKVGDKVEDVYVGDHVFFGKDFGWRQSDEEKNEVQILLRGAEIMCVETGDI